MPHSLRRHYFRRLVLLVGALLLAQLMERPKLRAQSLPAAGAGTVTPAWQDSAYRPAFATLPQDDYWNLRRMPRKQHLKQLPVAGLDSARVSFSGTAYLLFDLLVNSSFGDLPGYDPILNRRANVFADVQFNSRWRFFGGLKHGGISFFNFESGGRNRDDLDVHQAFIEYAAGTPGRKGGRWLLRAGRQELRFGSGRIFGNRNGVNVRDDHTGALFRHWGKAGRTEAFFVFENEDGTGFFDNHVQPDRRHWGIYREHRLGAGSLDYYYFGYDLPGAAYNTREGRDRRHLLGVRWHRLTKFTGWAWDFELTGQVGEFAGRPARGLSFAFDGGYRFEDVAGQPFLGVRGGITSGDRDSTDRRQTTFRAPNPPALFFGDTNPFGPGNLAGVWIHSDIVLFKRLSVSPRTVYYWRVEEQDAIYSTTNGILRPGAGRANYLGREYGLVLSAPLSPHVVFSSKYATFRTSSGFFGENSPGKDIEVYEVFLQYTF